MCSCSGSCNCNSTTIPKGPQGSVGPIGGVGPAGPPNTLTIGNVDEGPADATITGTSPNQILNLVIPQGPAGATGPNGTTRLHYLAGSASGSTLTPSWQNIDFYQLPANTLVNNGDSIIISTLHLQNNNPINITLMGINIFNPAHRRITFNSVNLTFNNGNELPDLSTSTYIEISNTFTYLFRTTVELIRTGANTATCKVLADIKLSKRNLETITCSTTITGLSFTTTNDIEFDVLQNTANQSVLKVLTIDLIKKV
jgi:hypothetical protein